MPEVQVTFQCERCGDVLLVSKHNQPEDVWMNVADTVTIGDFVCKKCTPLSYGPLTVEMVAEALWVAYWESSIPWTSLPKGVRDGMFAEARFVLRLLNAIADSGDSYCRLTNTDASARGELLNLARQP